MYFVLVYLALAALILLFEKERNPARTQPRPPTCGDISTAPSTATTPAGAREVLTALAWDCVHHPTTAASTGDSPLAGAASSSTPPPRIVSAVANAVRGDDPSAYRAVCDLFATVHRQSDLVCSRCKQVGHLVDQCQFSALDAADSADDVDDVCDDGARQATFPASSLVGSSDHIPVCRYCKQVGHETDRCPNRRR